MKINLPTALTFFRLALIPIFIILFYLPTPWSAFYSALIFLIAAITDWIDGYLARLLQQSTRFGAFLDPVADKLMVASALVLVTEYYHSWWITLPAIIMIARELTISALREWMAEIGKRGLVSVSWIAKVKTVAQMTALVWLIWRPNDYVIVAAILALYIAVTLTIYSMYQYLSASRSELMNN